MKKQILFQLILVFVTLAGTCQSFSNPQLYNPRRVKFVDLRKKQTLRISPQHFIDNQFYVSTEIFNTRTFKKSTLIGLHAIYADNNKVMDGGFALDLERRFYPRSFSCDSLAAFNNSADGFYVGFGVQLGYSEYRDKTLTRVAPPYYSEKVNVWTKNTWVTPMVSLGYQFIVFEALYIDVFVGGGLKINNVEKGSPDKTLNLDQFYDSPNLRSRDYKGMMLRGGVSFGIGF